VRGAGLAECRELVARAQDFPGDVFPALAAAQDHQRKRRDVVGRIARRDQKAIHPVLVELAEFLIERQRHAPGGSLNGVGALACSSLHMHVEVLRRIENCIRVILKHLARVADSAEAFDGIRIHLAPTVIHAEHHFADLDSRQRPPQRLLA
jgi:hypothetical protein